MEEKFKTPESHNFCIACGEKNPISLKLKFFEENNKVAAWFRPSGIHQGYKETLHGGITSAILDSAMTNALFFKGIEAFTGELNVRYFKPVPIYSDLKVTAWLEEERHGIFFMKSEMKLENEIMAKATAKFVKIKK